MAWRGLGASLQLVLTTVIVVTLPPWCHTTSSSGGQWAVWSELFFYSMCSEDIPFMIRSTPNDCSQYIVCSAGRVMPGRCPQGYVFSSFHQRCQAPSRHERLHCSRELLATMPYTCMWHPYSRVASYVSCAQYFDCQSSTQDEPRSYVTECPYPKLFSLTTRRCEPFYRVACQGRAVPKAPCDYLQYQQLYGEDSSKECAEHHPNCVRRRDGQYRVNNSTNSYFVCRSERTVNIRHCRPGSVFSDRSQRCEKSAVRGVNLDSSDSSPTLVSPTLISNANSVSIVRNRNFAQLNRAPGYRVNSFRRNGNNSIPSQGFSKGRSVVSNKIT